MHLIMNNQETINYQRVAQAIVYIKENFKQQPSLDCIAAAVNLSPFHFQRLFTDWAGVSPKKFIQYLSVEYAKGLLNEKRSNLFDVAYDTGLSGTGRLHDLFVTIEGMTPGEFKNGGQSLVIRYSFSYSLFGEILVASTDRGICHLAFIEERSKSFAYLKQRFPRAGFLEQEDVHQKNALRIFTPTGEKLEQVRLHLKGTDFQLKVWEALLKIPEGNLSSYGHIAGLLGNQKASRAVGSAIGDNPIAFLIPCHRVIRAEGTYGQYRWGSTRKLALIGWEAARRWERRGKDAGDQELDPR